MRLIDADALIESLSINPEECPGCPEPEWLEELADIIDTAQTVEVPEIILCKDCREFRRYIDTDITFCDRTEVEVKGDDFCSHAERRSDGVDSQGRNAE